MAHPHNLARSLRARLDSVVVGAQGVAQAHPEADPLRAVRRFGDRLSRASGLERLLPIGLCALLVGAAVVSTLPTTPVPSAPTQRPATITAVVAGQAPSARYGSGDGPAAPDTADLYLGDGSIPNSLQNPGVGMDAATQMRIYTVQAGDTLNAIAGQFGLAPSTLYWANKSKLPDPASLRVGQELLILPIDGLVVTVGAKDTLDTLAARFKVTVQDIVDTNNLPEAKVVLGQTLIIPGASGGPVPKPKAASGSSSRGWVWPVGGSNYISQYFWSGHHAIDIAADSGTPVIASVSGTVVFAGYKGSGTMGYGGGNVIWVMNGTRLYTTYNHLSYIGVRNGQRVTAGQVIGRVGQTGMATGPHLHFEVWIGYPWGLGTVANAVNPCVYLAGC